MNVAFTRIISNWNSRTALRLRHQSGLFVDAGLILLTIWLSVFVTSCDTHNQSKDQIGELDNAITAPEDAVLVYRTPETSRVPVTFTLAGSTFVVPTGVVGIQVSYQRQIVDYVALGVYFSESDGRSLASVGDRMHRIEIELKAMEREPTLPETRKQAESVFASRFPDTIFASSENAKLESIVLVPEGDRSYIGYRRTDNYIRPGDGRVPYVICSTVPPALCTGHGYLMPEIAVTYRFHTQQIAHWKEIDINVFQYLEKIRAGTD